MDIHGLQKLSLLDYPGKVACTVFLGGCNFRCPYCHNSELLSAATPPVMTSEELLAFLKTRGGLIDGVCVTGGEPLTRADIGELLAAIKRMGFSVKLDTNGAYPARLRALIADGLIDYVAMDVKNSRARYAETVGLNEMDLTPIEESVDYLLSGVINYEFRTTVVSPLHDEDALRDIASWLAGARRYFLQPFADRDTVPFSGLSAPSDEALKKFVSIAREKIASVAVRGR